MLESLQKEMPMLEQHNNSANWQIQKYKEDVLSLQDNLRKLVVVLDFTKFNQVSSLELTKFTPKVKSGHVHDLVIVLLRKMSANEPVSIRFRDFLS